MNRSDREPPRLAESLLLRAVPPGIAGKSIVGDAREEYLAYCRSNSLIPGPIWYWIYIMPIIARFIGGKTPETAPMGQPIGAFYTRLGNLMSDLRIALRMLRRKPGFTVAAILTLGLGIGANTTIFSLVDGILLRPLPYPDAERLVGVYRIDPEVTGPDPAPEWLVNLWAVPYEVFNDWRDMSPVFESAGAHHEPSFTLTEGDQPETLSGAMVTSGVFQTLGVAPVLGRPLIPADDEVGAPSHAVLSYGLWQRRYGGDPGIIGNDMMLNGTSYEVVGVMPRGFGFPFGEEDVWVSFDDARKTSPVRNGGYLQVIARVKPGISLEQAQLEMDAVARRNGERHPEEVEHGIGLFSHKELLISNSRSGLLMLLGAVGLVLLIACANIANLLLVRATERRRELGVRQALGAGRGRLLTQHMSESLVLALVGGVAGGLVAVATLKPFVAAFPGDLPRAHEIAVDYRMLLIAIGLSVATGLLTGVLPAIRAVTTPIVDVLQDGARGFAGGLRRNRTQALLVVSEVALAFVLLVGAGLFIRSLTRLTSVDRGFVSEGIISMPVVLPARYRDSIAVSNAFYRELYDRLGAVPGVELIANASQMPFVGGMSWPPTSVETNEGVVEDIVHSSTVSDRYFQAMSIPVLSGRPFDATDLEDAEPVIVVNEAFAKHYWPDEVPIGRRVRRDFPGDSTWRTVVGVVGDIRNRLDQDPFPEFFLPTSQDPWWYQIVVIKAGIEPAALIPQIRDALWAIDRDVPAYARALDDRINSSGAVAGPRFGVFILGVLSGLAALLAIVGIYGVLAYTVSQRSKEIGIRMALGAARHSVVRGVIKRGLMMACSGLAIGVGISFAAGRVIENQLFEVRATDPLTMVSVGLLILAATVAASYIPAWRATKVDPVEALRNE